MSIDTALHRYFDAWNSHEPGQVVAALTDDGTYEDPTTGGPLSGDELTANVAGVCAGFPDVRFETVTVDTTGDTTACAQWRMLGTNTGPLQVVPPPALRSTSRRRLLHLRPHADRVSRVVGYFDTATMLGQLGLQTHLPADIDGMLQFGIAAGSRPAGTRSRCVHRHLDRRRSRAPDASRRRGHRHRHGAARQRTTSARASPRGPPQLHLHRLDQPRSGAGALRGVAHEAR
jgi:hypothetical protein